MEFLTQDPDHIRGEFFPRVIGPIGDALHPHRAGEEIGAGQSDFDRAGGQAVEKSCLVDAKRLTATQRAKHRRMADFAGRDIECTQLTLEFFGVIDVRQQVGNRNQLAVVEQPAHEAGVIVPTLLTVCEYVYPGPLLGGDRQPHGVVSGLAKLFI